jgi:uncharacterized protein YdhG (YjbR/CyaY superfamily)
MAVPASVEEYLAALPAERRRAMETLRARVEADDGAELARYAHGRGTLRFPAGEPIPVGLVARIVRTRLEEDADRRRR